ncbi:MAG TPA: LysM peptidoglycan-binding domain-containing protein [Clostridia bacterium]|nr:LysM peptidoglycan-binding domain-containing protein [Clostridia bacterium]
MFKPKKAVAFLTTAVLSFSIIIPAYAANYTVKAGDSLFTIGRQYNTTSASLMTLNKLSNSTIYPGQVLTVPSARPATYTVLRDDSLFLIAKKFGMTVTELRQLNNKWDNEIYPGQVLKLSTSTTAVSTAANTANKGVIPYTAADLDLMARLITAEAGGESYTAKVGVGAVVVNRVKSPDFPNTIKGVIYDRYGIYYQFTPVENGWINKPATADSRRAALDALNGVDPTNGALYYFDDSTTSKWIWSKPISVRIGHMVYSYA